MFSQCLVYRELHSQATALRAFALSIQRINRELGIRLIPEGRNDRGNATEFTWIDATAPGRMRVIWCDDAAIPAQYLEVASLDRTLTESGAKIMMGDLPILTPGEALSAVDADLVANPGAITRLALATRGKPDQTVAHHIASALHHPNRTVRWQAQMAAYLVDWEELDPAVCDAFMAERDADLRPGLEYLVQRARTRCQE